MNQAVFYKYSFKAYPVCVAHPGTFQDPVRIQNQGVRNLDPEIKDWELFFQKLINEIGEECLSEASREYPAVDYKLKNIDIDLFHVQLLPRIELPAPERDPATAWMYERIENTLSMSLLGMRPYNILLAFAGPLIGDLVGLSESTVKGFSGMGRTSLLQLNRALAEKSLRLGMDTRAWEAERRQERQHLNLTKKEQ